MSNGLESIVDTPGIQEVLQQKDQQIASLQGELFVLKEQLDWLKRQIFGSKSERIVADLESQPLLPALELGPPIFVPAPQEEITYQRNKPSKNRGSDTISFPADLPVKVVELDLPEDEKICPETGEPLVCKARPELGVKYLGLPDAVIPRCPADESLLAFVLTSKFADHLPLYRLVEIFERSKIKISRQTLSNWVLSLGSALAPVYDAMKARVLEGVDGARHEWR